MTTDVHTATSNEFIFTITDNILPMLHLDERVKICLRINNRSIRLSVGRRDWEWDIRTGELIGCGTRMFDRDM